MRFKVKNRKYSNKIFDKINNGTGIVKHVDINGVISFDWEEIYNIAKCTGLRSSKRRHIVKRFRIVMHDAIINLLNSLKSVDNTTS